MSADYGTAVDAARAERVLERITRIRKRGPRLTDQVATLAHGAGGKASAALADALFLETAALVGRPAGTRRSHE